MFGALQYTSILFVVGWLLVGAEVVEAGLGLLLHGQPVSQDTRMLLSVAVGAAGSAARFAHLLC